MSAQHRHADKFAWDVDDLIPAWLVLVPREQCLQLTRLLATAAGQEAQARRMVTASPWPRTKEDASARAASVIEFLLEEPA